MCLPICCRREREWEGIEVLLALVGTFVYWIATMIANGTCCPDESASSLPTANGVNSEQLVYAYGGFSIGWVLLTFVLVLLSRGNECVWITCGVPYFSVLLYFLVAAWNLYGTHEDEQSVSRNVLTVMTGVHILLLKVLTFSRQFFYYANEC